MELNSLNKLTLDNCNMVGNLIYYTYAYLREDRTPYYIGRGKGKRVIDPTHRVKVPPRNRIILLKINLNYEEATRHEVYLISVLGRKDIGTGILRNLTNGGERRRGPKSKEEIEKIRKANLGEKMRDEVKRRLSEVKKGIPIHTEEMKERFRRAFIENNPNSSGDANRGKFYWNDGKNNRLCKECPGPCWVRGAISKGFSNNKHTLEVREKFSEDRRKRRHWVNKDNESKFQENSPGLEWQNGRKWREGKNAN